MVMSTISSSYLSFSAQSSINSRASMASSIFGSLSSSQSSFLGYYSLADYKSIKNGSYGKIVKATYAKENAASKVSSNSTSGTTSATTGTARTLTSYEKNSSLDKLLSTYKDSAATAATGTTASTAATDTAAAAKNLSASVSDIEKLETSDMDEAATAVQKFVDAYNKTVTAGSGSNITSVVRNTTWMTGTTDSRSSALSEVGITIGSDKTLSFDKNVFKNADDSRINTLFAADDASTSYADSYIAEIGNRADKIAGLAASGGTSQSTYTKGATYTGTQTGSALDIQV